MHRNDYIGANPENAFTDRDPIRGRRHSLQGEARWLNSVQSELIAPIVQTGAALDPADDRQLVTSVTLHVRSLAVLRNAPTPQVAPGRTVHVFVEGRNSVDDGGDGLFRWEAAATATDDGDLVISPSTRPASGRWIRVQLTGRWRLQQGEVLLGLSPVDYRYRPGESARHVSDRSGAHDVTAELQRLFTIARASGYYSHPWSGAGETCPVVQLEPGRYRLSGTIVVGTGTTLMGKAPPCNTTNHTRLIMDSTATSSGGGNGDNRNTPMFRFDRATIDNGAMMNRALTVRVQWLETWFVTMGNNFELPLGGAGIDPSRYPDGCTFLIDVDVADSRFTQNCFQHSTRTLLIRNVNRTAAPRGDGHPGSMGGVGIYFEQNEWDAHVEHWRAEGSHLRLHFKGDHFWDGAQVARGCTGTLTWDDCELFGGACIDLDDAGNHFEAIKYTGRADLSTRGPTIAIRNAKNIDIDITMNGESSRTGILLTNCDGGRVRVNIVNSGRNAIAGQSERDFVAAVKLVGCRHVRVEGYIGDTLGGEAYHAFGVLSVDSDRRAYANEVDVHVQAPMNGAAHRGQSRHVNVGPDDIVSRRMLGQDPSYLRDDLRARGAALRLNSGPHRSTEVLDVDELLPQDGTYLLIVQSYPITAPASLSCAVYAAYRRAAGGSCLVALGVANSGESGAIASAGSHIRVSSQGDPFRYSLFCHRIAAVGVS